MALIVVFLSACVNHNEYALRVGAPPLEEGETTVSLRAIQIRSFDTLETARIIQASTATLQDLGFTVGAASGDYGVLAASKERDAVETGQVAGQLALAVMFALMGSSYSMVYDESQQINVSLLVSPRNEQASEVRVIFDRHLTNNHGQLWKAEVIKDEEIYQQFFEKLSASLFLEAHAL